MVKNKSGRISSLARMVVPLHEKPFCAKIQKDRSTFRGGAMGVNFTTQYTYMGISMQTGQGRLNQLFFVKVCGLMNHVVRISFLS